MEIARIYRKIGLYGEHSITGIGRSIVLASGEWQFLLLTKDGASIPIDPPSEHLREDIERVLEGFPVNSALVTQRCWPALLPYHASSLEAVFNSLPSLGNVTKSKTGLEYSAIKSCYTVVQDDLELNDAGKKHKVACQASVDELLGNISEPIERYLLSLDIPLTHAKAQNPVEAILAGNIPYGSSIRLAINALRFSDHSEQIAKSLAESSNLDSIHVEDLLFSAPKKSVLQALSNNQAIGFPVGVIYQLMQHKRRPRPDIKIPIDWMTNKTVEKMCFSAIEYNSPKACEHLLKWPILEKNERFQRLREMLVSRLEGSFRAKSEKYSGHY